MMRYFFLCFLFFASLVSAVETREDIFNKKYFQAQYEAGLKGAPTLRRHTIPRIIHFIWLDRENPPKEVLANMASWKKFHPGWTIKLWSSREKSFKIPGIQHNALTELFDTPLLSSFLTASHIAEKADLLRYALLYRDGGVVVDLSMRCEQSLDAFHDAYDFYAGLEESQDTILSTSVFVSTNLIAAKPGHPIIRGFVTEMKKNRDNLDSFYPGDAPAIIKARIAYRTVDRFNEAVKLYAAPEIDMIFPNTKGFGQKLFDDPHLFLKSRVERKMLHQLQQLKIGQSEVYLIAIIITGLNLATFFFFILGFRRAFKKTTA